MYFNCPISTSIMGIILILLVSGQTLEKRAAPKKWCLP